MYFLGNLNKKGSYWNGLCTNRKGTQTCNKNEQAGLENLCMLPLAKKKKYSKLRKYEGYYHRIWYHLVRCAKACDIILGQCQW